MIFDQLGAFLVGVLATALAAPRLFAAVTERALQAPIPRAVVALAAGWVPDECWSRWEASLR